MSAEPVLSISYSFSNSFSNSKGVGGYGVGSGQLPAEPAFAGSVASQPAKA
jgi:hypothetical protein